MKNPKLSKKWSKIKKKKRVRFCPHLGGVILCTLSQSLRDVNGKRIGPKRGLPRLVYNNNALILILCDIALFPLKTVLVSQIPFFFLIRGQYHRNSL